VLVMWEKQDIDARMRGKSKTVWWSHWETIASKRNTAKRLYRRRKKYVRGGKEAIKKLGNVNVRWYSAWLHLRVLKVPTRRI
jgi:hypothetical protein